MNSSCFQVWWWCWFMLSHCSSCVYELWVWLQFKSILFSSVSSLLRILKKYSSSTLVSCFACFSSSSGQLYHWRWLLETRSPIAAHSRCSSPSITALHRLPHFTFATPLALQAFFLLVQMVQTWISFCNFIVWPFSEISIRKTALRTQGEQEHLRSVASIQRQLFSSITSQDL